MIINVFEMSPDGNPRIKGDEMLAVEEATGLRVTISKGRFADEVRARVFLSNRYTIEQPATLLPTTGVEKALSNFVLMRETLSDGVALSFNVPYLTDETPEGAAKRIFAKVEAGLKATKNQEHGGIS